MSPVATTIAFVVDLVPGLGASDISYPVLSQNPAANHTLTTGPGYVASTPDTLLQFIVTLPITIARRLQRNRRGLVAIIGLQIGHGLFDQRVIRTMATAASSAASAHTLLHDSACQFAAYGTSALDRLAVDRSW